MAQSLEPRLLGPSCYHRRSRLDTARLWTLGKGWDLDQDAQRDALEGLEYSTSGIEGLGETRLDRRCQALSSDGLNLGAISIYPAIRSLLNSFRMMFL